MECYGQTHLSWVKWELSKSHVRQQHIFSSRESVHANDTFGVWSSLIQLILSHFQLLQTGQCSANILLILCGESTAHKFVFVLIMLGNLGSHTFPSNSPQGTLKTISTSKQTLTHLCLLSFSPKNLNPRCTAPTSKLHYYSFRLVPVNWKPIWW